MKGIVVEFSRVSNCCRGFTRNKSLLGFRRNCCRVLKILQGLKRNCCSVQNFCCRGLQERRLGRAEHQSEDESMDSEEEFGQSITSSSSTSSSSQSITITVIVFLSPLEAKVAWEAFCDNSGDSRCFPISVRGRWRRRPIYEFPIFLMLSTTIASYSLPEKRGVRLRISIYLQHQNFKTDQ